MLVRIVQTGMIGVAKKPVVDKPVKVQEKKPLAKRRYEIFIDKIKNRLQERRSKKEEIREEEKKQVKKEEPKTKTTTFSSKSTGNSIDRQSAVKSASEIVKALIEQNEKGESILAILIIVFERTGEVPINKVKLITSKKNIANNTDIHYN